MLSERELTAAQQALLQHDSPALQYVLLQQVAFFEIQNGPYDATAGMQHVSENLESKVSIRPSCELLDLFYEGGQMYDLDQNIRTPSVQTQNHLGLLDIPMLSRPRHYDGRAR